jgi:hypothetical protein
MDHVTAIITQLAQGLFESIGSSLLRTVRGKGLGLGLAPSEPATRRGPGLKLGFQLRLLHQSARVQDRPRQLAVYRIDLQSSPRRVTKSR